MRASAMLTSAGFNIPLLYPTTTTTLSLPPSIPPTFQPAVLTSAFAAWTLVSSCNSFMQTFLKNNSYVTLLNVSTIPSADIKYGLFKSNNC